jgi:hypothetical protein
MAIFFTKHEFIEELIFSFITLLFYAIFLYIFYFYYAIYIEEDIVKLQSANLCTYITTHINLFSIFIKKDENGDFILDIPKNDYISYSSSIPITEILKSSVSKSDTSSANSKIDENNSKLKNYALISVIFLIIICLVIISILCYFYKINPSFLILKSIFLVICIAIIEILFLQQVSSNVVTINVTKPIAAFLESLLEVKQKEEEEETRY